MSSYKRKKRTLKKRILVFFEGYTENHYVVGLKNWIEQIDPSINIAIKTINIEGGGYLSILTALNKQPDSGCIAKIVLFDFDRYLNHKDEKIVFEKLLSLSQNSNKRNRIPCILIGTCPKFEYCLCCHSSQYGGSDIPAFMKAKWGYLSSDDCKNDKKIWEKVHRGNSDHSIALKYLESRPRAIKNDFEYVANNCSIRLFSVAFDSDALSSKGSNFGDLFKALGVIC